MAAAPSTAELLNGGRSIILKISRLIIFMFLMGSIIANYLPQTAMKIAWFFALPCILLYEFILKRIPLIGNIVVSLLVGVVFVFASTSLEAKGYDAYKIMVLAFFLNFQSQ